MKLTFYYKKVFALLLFRWTYVCVCVWGRKNWSKRFRAQNFMGASNSKKLNQNLPENALFFGKYVRPVWARRQEVLLTYSHNVIPTIAI